MKYFRDENEAAIANLYDHCNRLESANNPGTTAGLRNGATKRSDKGNKEYARQTQAQVKRKIQEEGDLPDQQVQTKDQDA